MSAPSSRPSLGSSKLSSHKGETQAAPGPGGCANRLGGVVAESPRTPWHCRLALAALSARSWWWTWKLYVREKEVRGGEKARQALTLPMPPPAKLSGLSWGYTHRELSALVCSCILSQTCSQLIWDVISFFFKTPTNRNPLSFPSRNSRMVGSGSLPGSWRSPRSPL